MHAPAADGPLDFATIASTQYASQLFSHLLRAAPQVKAIARTVIPNLHNAAAPVAASSGGLFVPADGGPPPPAEDDDDDDAPQTILQILSENLSLALLSRSRADTSDRDSREWDRLVVAYLGLLSQWLWDDPASVREFLNAGGLGVLVEPVNQVAEADTVVPGLCAFLLGVCYEFNREPGEITRSTIHPILSRLGEDTLFGRITKLKEDERLKMVGPESVVFLHPSSHGQHGGKAELEEYETWFDWPFADFFKSNFCEFYLLFERSA